MKINYKGSGKYEIFFYSTNKSIEISEQEIQELCEISSENFKKEVKNFLPKIFLRGKDEPQKLWD